jgi:4-hydroxy-4-methyl-2-oxoglutarate aldolase
MLIRPTPDEVVAMTSDNPFDRLGDGRPLVPDRLLVRPREATTEQAWSVLRDAGYHQLEGGWQETQPGGVPVGRAVTVQFVPLRPDYDEAVWAEGAKKGRTRGGGQNSWVIDELRPGEVMVVDISGEVRDGTVVGDNLGTAVQVRTGAGAVIDGGIRDLQGLAELVRDRFGKLRLAQGRYTTGEIDVRVWSEEVEQDFGPGARSNAVAASDPPAAGTPRYDPRLD